MIKAATACKIDGCDNPIAATHGIYANLCVEHAAEAKANRGRRRSAPATPKKRRTVSRMPRVEPDSTGALTWVPLDRAELDALAELLAQNLNGDQSAALLFKLEGARAISAASRA